MKKVVNIRPLLEEIERKISRAFISVMSRSGLSFAFHTNERNRANNRVRLIILLQSLRGVYQSKLDDD